MFVHVPITIVCFHRRYRARIVSIHPLKIHFIDFGNIENADPSDLKCLPEDLMYIKPLVSCILYRIIRVIFIRDSRKLALTMCT